MFYNLDRTHVGAIAKWLRRQIRNLFLFEGAGSSPAGVASSKFFPFFVAGWNNEQCLLLTYVLIATILFSQILHF